MKVRFLVDLMSLWSRPRWATRQHTKAAEPWKSLYPLKPKHLCMWYRPLKTSKASRSKSVQDNKTKKPAFQPRMPLDLTGKSKTDKQQKSLLQLESNMILPPADAGMTFGLSHKTLHIYVLEQPQAHAPQMLEVWVAGKPPQQMLLQNTSQIQHFAVPITCKNSQVIFVALALQNMLRAKGAIGQHCQDLSAVTYFLVTQDQKRNVSQAQLSQPPGLKNPIKP